VKPSHWVLGTKQLAVTAGARNELGFEFQFSLRAVWLLARNLTSISFHLLIKER
jgi:hypothetical protein